MSSRSSRNKKLRVQTGAAIPTGDQRSKLAYKFAKYIIKHFQDSKAAYVQQFLEPVDEEADKAPHYYKIIKHPMDLTTIMQELESGEYHSTTDVRASFERMLNNCFEYITFSDSPVYRKGKKFQNAFLKKWDEKDDWIRERAAESDESSEVEIEDDSIEGRLHDTPDDGRNDDENESTEEASEDDNEQSRNHVLQGSDLSKGVQEVETSEESEILDETSEESSSSEDGAESRYAQSDNSTEDDTNDSSEESLHETSDDDPMEGIDPSNIYASDNDDTSDNVLPETLETHIFQGDDSEEDDPPKKPVQKSRARKKDGSKRHFGLGINNKRLLDTGSATESSTPSSPQQQPLATEQPTATRTDASSHSDASSAEQGPAKRPRLEPSAESPSDSSLQSPTRQPRIQEPAKRSQQPPITEERYNPAMISSSFSSLIHLRSLSGPFRAVLSNMVAEQITSLTTRITTNAEGEFNQHLYIWNLLCRNEQHLVSERVWKVKAMDKVGRMQFNDITTLAVKEHVKTAFKETVMELWGRAKKELDREAAALSACFDRHDGSTSNV